MKFGPENPENSVNPVEFVCRIVMRNAAQSAKDALRKDLQSAMRAGETLAVNTLRSLIAAIDNAEAVPVGDTYSRYIVRRFGDGSAEAPR